MKAIVKILFLNIFISFSCANTLMAQIDISNDSKCVKGYLVHLYSSIINDSTSHSNDYFFFVSEPQFDNDKITIDDFPKNAFFVNVFDYIGKNLHSLLNYKSTDCDINTIIYEGLFGNKIKKISLRDKIAEVRNVLIVFNEKQETLENYINSSKSSHSESYFSIFPDEIRKKRIILYPELIIELK